MQDHNPSYSCVRCVPVTVNGYGWIQPYTLELGAYRSVVNGQYNSVSSQGKGEWVLGQQAIPPPQASQGGRPSWNPQGHGQTRASMPPVNTPILTGRGSVNSEESHPFETELSQWLAGLGISHYHKTLRGLTVAQVMDMDTQQLQQAGVVTSNALVRIRRAKDAIRQLPTSPIPYPS